MKGQSVIRQIMVGLSEYDGIYIENAAESTFSTA